jgi:hypothetical protein
VERGNQTEQAEPDSMCNQPLELPTLRFIACGRGSLILAISVQLPEPPAKIITPNASATRVRTPAI